MQLAIEAAFKKTFTDTHYVSCDKDILGTREGYSHFSKHPVSDHRGRIASDRNKGKDHDKRTEFYEFVEWERTKEPYKHKALSGEELEIHEMYLRISKEPEYAF
jgi:hypothetical protein